MNTPDSPSTNSEDLVPERDEDLMRRFLVDEATADERDAVEQRFIDEPAFFEELCALEHEMMLALVREELPGRWAQPLRAALAASPDRQRHLDDLRDLVAAMPPRAPASAPSAWRRPGAPPRWLGVAALIVLSVGVGTWWWRATPDGRPASKMPSAAEPAGSIATFILAPGPTRSATADVNYVQIAADVSHVRLVAVLDAPSGIAIDARMRPIGGSFLELPPGTRSKPALQGLEVSWDVPVSLVGGGDYLITYERREDTGTSVTVGTRFVRIVK